MRTSSVARALLCSALVATTGCGRSTLIAFDDGCPPGVDCVPLPDAAPGGDGGPRDGGSDGFGDGGLDGFGDGGLDGFGDGGCLSTEDVCDNGQDDDCDGLTDCQDPSCQAIPACLNQKKENCSNKKDDDGNGLIDCQDPACFGDKACLEPGVEVCNNLLDDDDDLLIDCADPDCAASPACKPAMGQEICNNGKDDNKDLLVDCSDPQCVSFPACLKAACDPEIDFGSLAPHDAMVTRAFDTTGATASYGTCAAPGGTARVGEFTLGAPADVRLDFQQPAGFAHVVAVFRAGVGQACDQNLVHCLVAGQMAAATYTFAALPAGTYRVIVQSYPGTQGPSSVTLSTGSSAMPEVCNNGKDDDGNGLIDCADLACVAAPSCLANQCDPDQNLGALVVDGPAKHTVASTTTSSNRYHPTCAGLSTGKDVTVRFTLHETAGVLVQWTQTGDHVFGLFQDPPPGQACDALQQSCYYPSGRSGGSVAFASRPPGSYVFIFKAIGAGQEGVLDLNISAYKNRQLEICSNGIDDDGNGLADCNDPECFGVGSCNAPLCLPDIDLGDFAWGTQRSTTLQVTSGADLYETSCGKGTGKERVVRLNLTQPMALGINCTETGSHVLQLAAQLNPLDACDETLVNCADPKVLPFGCNFAMPNLQAGRYNLIVEAFQLGTEGTVNLSLSGIQEKILETCDNGVDDDLDGAIDCADKKCVTSPLCATLACRADQRLGLIPLDATPTSIVVQTANAGDDQQDTPCASAQGGQDAVVDFTLPAKTELKIEWAQVGNHVLSLYANDNDLLACDASPLVSCTPSAGQATGSINLAGVPQGKYHLVVDADKPGSEGGVVLQVSGTISP